jgi:hypothetical protein
MNTTKKTEAEKQLIKFRNQLHNLLIKYPDIRISGDRDGDVFANITPNEPYAEMVFIYLPTSGHQEPIKVLTANGVPVSL